MNADRAFEIRCDLNVYRLHHVLSSSIPHLICVAVTTLEASLSGPGLALEGETSLRTLS